MGRDFLTDALTMIVCAATAIALSCLALGAMDKEAAIAAEKTRAHLSQVVQPVATR